MTEKLNKTEIELKHPNPEWFVLVELPDKTFVQPEIVIGKRDSLFNPDVDLYDYDEDKVSKEHIFIEPFKKTFRLSPEVLAKTYHNGILIEPDIAYPLNHNDVFNIGILQISIQFIDVTTMKRRAQELGMEHIKWIEENESFPWTPWNPKGEKLTDLVEFNDNNYPQYVIRRAKRLLNRSSDTDLERAIKIVKINQDAERNEVAADPNGPIIAFIRSR